jgi:hypothetical protein
VAALGAFNRSGGTVNLTGSLINSNATLVLGVNTGSWVLNGGAIRGGTVTMTNDTSLIVSGTASILAGTMK